MGPKRHQLVEHAILTLVLRYSDHLGYGNTLPGLAQILRQTVADIDNREVVDTLKRLRPQYLTLWKWSEEHHRFLEYPTEIPRDEDFFYQADFRLRHTPHTDPYVQTLALEMNPPEVKPSMTPLDEAARKARFERFEKLGLDRVKSDLTQTGGIRDVGGPLEVRELAWEWVRMKEKEAAAGAPQASHNQLTLISDVRLDDLRSVASGQFDFRKLIRLCEEINTSFSSGCYFAAAMLTRGLLDHVPPVFSFKTFSEVANNYSGGGKSFKDTMQHLENASRKVADAHLHMPIRKSETLPTAQQVNCGQQLDVLLAEIVRITR
jgi:hypothetical protein